MSSGMTDIVMRGMFVKFHSTAGKNTARFTRKHTVAFEEQIFADCEGLRAVGRAFSLAQAHVRDKMH